MSTHPAHPRASLVVSGRPVQGWAQTDPDVELLNTTFLPHPRGSASFLVNLPPVSRYRILPLPSPHSFLLLPTHPRFFLSTPILVPSQKPSYKLSLLSAPRWKSVNP